ncbi:MAG: hypothetical protein C4560_13265 [Nitrospiraceae bacterium]|nr:MAG: hypothetical protein C4560_13265 [Nitrospiraceae bacterium]
MKRLLFIFLIFLSGCASIPFQKTSCVPLDSVGPWTLVEEFRNNSPEKFQLINSIVFEYNWNKFSGIGFIDVNAVEKTFTAVCINPMGVKLFELTGDRDRTDSRFVLKQFAEKGNFADKVGEDIRRVYFDLVPSSVAQISRKKYQIKFTEPAGTGFMEYIFAGAGGRLIEKNHYEDNKLDWRVSYYEYRQENGKIYPGGIILNNYKYGYSLTVKLKEIRT